MIEQEAPAPARAERLALTYEETAEALSVSVNYVRWLVSSGKLRAVVLGHRTRRVPVSEVEKLLSGG